MRPIDTSPFQQVAAMAIIQGFVGFRFYCSGSGGRSVLKALCASGAAITSFNSPDVRNNTLPFHFAVNTAPPLPPLVHKL